MLLTLLGAFHVHEISFQSLLFEYDTLYVTTMSFNTLAVAKERLS